MLRVRSVWAETPQRRVESAPEQGPRLGRRGEEEVPAPPTHRGGQRGSLPTASMLRAPQHGQASRAAGGGSIAPSRDQEDEGEGFPWEVGPGSQASRPGSGDEAQLRPRSTAVRSRVFTEAEKSETREPCIGITALPCPLWPLLGVGGWGRTLLEEARQAAARPRSLPPRPASCPSERSPCAATQGTWEQAGQ